MKNLWKGIAIVGIWVAVAIAVIEVEDTTVAGVIGLMGFFFALVATVYIGTKTLN
jgi:hypothetical protein